MNRDLVRPANERAIAPDEPAPAPKVAAPAQPRHGDTSGGQQQGRQQERREAAPMEPSVDVVPPGAIAPAPMMGGATPPLAGAQEGAAVQPTADAARRVTMPTPASNVRQDDGVGPITVRREIVGHEPVKPMTSPAAASTGTPVMPLALTAPQVIAAINDGLPIHFSQLPALMESVLSQKPIVERTVEVVLEPANLGRIKLELTLADGGQALKLVIHTQTVAAQRVMESFLPKVQQIAQGQGYALREADVRVSDRPIRAESRQGDNPAGGRQGRRRRRGGGDAAI